MPKKIYIPIVTALFILGIPWAGKTYVDYKVETTIGDIKVVNVHLLNIYSRLDSIDTTLKNLLKR